MSDVEIAGGHPAVRVTRATACRRHAARGPLLAAAGWLAGAVAALTVAAVPYDVGEALCGVWGCFPPLPATVAMHLLWCAVLGAGVDAVSTWRPGLLRPVGILLLFGAMTAITLVVGSDLTRLLSHLPGDYHTLWPRRVGYTLATATDVPLV